MRLFRLLCAAGVSLSAAAAQAACVGTDLLSALPPAERAALTAAANAHPNPDGILWRAEKPGRIVFVVGTLHVPDPRHQRTLDQIALWIDAADTVFLETEPGDGARLRSRIAAQPDLAYILSGPTIPDLLGETDWARLRTELSDLGIPTGVGSRMKPWMLLVNLGLSACPPDTADQSTGGLDQMITDYAVRRGKTPRRLEPYDTALRIFEVISQENQIEILQMTLAQRAGDPVSRTATVVEAYFREEIRVIWEYTMRRGGTDPRFTQQAYLAAADRIEDAVVIRRNRNWMHRILPAARRGTVFVAVGAMHLPGAQGLLNLLAEQGYTLTRIPRPPQTPPAH